MRVFKSRYLLLAMFIVFFLSFSFLLRTSLIVLNWEKADLSFASLIAIYTKGFLFDFAVASFFSALYAVYLLLLPEKWNRSAINKLITYTGFFFVILICMFSFFAEITFWQEFDSRFNFIAVDYLVYTYEVINNINQSYPLPYLVSAMLVISIAILFVFEKRRIFAASFYSVTPLRSRLLFTGSILAFALTAGFLLSNSWAEISRNRYQNELSKAGIFSFFAAFKNNELDYYAFYKKENEALTFSFVRNDLKEANALFLKNDQYNIRRLINNPGEMQKPNVIMVTIESLSADFMAHFGNTGKLTPTLDSLANEGLLFTDMYATGTRTVRGMEALTLSIPPTPGNSIVRRQNNENMFCVGTVFKKAGYTRTFFYGGDGYFDNMNAFFGNNGFDITDRGSGLVPGEHFHGVRTTIPDKAIHFENAWGICDEDLYDAVISNADQHYKKHELFYDFVMTTSNHRPYTYPEGKIDLLSGSGRDGAVKYTDYAIGQFIKKIKTKPWFNNTVIIFIADHCASSAGKNEINISRYHIPCIIYNLKVPHPSKIDVQCSQIDLYPTLLGLLHWQYESNFYGKNVLLPSYQPRALLGTYQKLGYLQSNHLLTLSPQQQVSETLWNKTKDEQKTVEPEHQLLHAAVADYQSAYYLYKKGLLKERN